MVRRGRNAIGVLPWLGLGLLAISGCPQSLEMMEPGDTRHSALVVGLDGADWDVLMPLIEAGYMPTIGGLIRSGARADFDCEPAWPQFACFCPPVWVSIATGRSVFDHKIINISDPSDQRGVPAIWQVMDAAGETSVLSSWRNTDPPEEGHYYVFTEQSNALAGKVNYNVWGTGGAVPPDPQLHSKPADLYDRLGLLPFTSERLESHGIMAKDRVAGRGFIRLAFELSGLVAQGPRPRLSMIILHSIDKSEHATWSMIQPQPGDPIDTNRILELAAEWQGPVFGPAPFTLGNPVSQYLEAEQWLTELLDIVRYDYVVFVSDHGMERSPEPGLAGKHGSNLPAAHIGIFAISGPGVPGDVVLDTVSVLDVAPTLAYLLDLPVAEDLPGNLLLDAFSQAWVDENPPSFVDSW
jgi:hypothetical protein